MKRTVYLLVALSLAYCGGQVTHEGGTSLPASGQGGSGGVVPEAAPPTNSDDAPSPDAAWPSVDGGSCMEAGWYPALLPPPACSPSASGTPCNDTASDPHNCGSCGHDCAGGACQAGVCQPCSLAAASDYGLVIDGSYAYFRNQGIGRVPLSGGPASLLTTLDLIPAAADANAIYGVDQIEGSGQVWRIPTQGGAPVQLTSTGGQIVGWTLDAGVLYVVVYLGNAVDKQLVSVPVDGSPTSVLAEGFNMGALLVLGETIYVTEHSMGSIVAVPKQGGSSVTLPLPAMADPAAIAYFGGQLFVANSITQSSGTQGLGEIWRFSPDGSGASRIADCQSQPRSILVDESGAFWGVDFGLMHLTPGETPTQIYHGKSQFQSDFAEDEHAFYWTDAVGTPGAQVMKLAR